MPVYEALPSTQASGRAAPEMPAAHDDSAASPSLLPIVTMHRYGHKLTIKNIDGALVAACECGQWRRALPLPNGADLVNLVGTLTGKHDRHLERLGRPSLMGDSWDGPLMPPKE